MGILGEALQNIKSYLSLASIIDVLDVALVAFCIYKLIVLVRKTTAAQVLKGIALLIVLLAFSGLVGLNVTNYILSNFMQVGFIAIIIMFQPELRRMLEQVGGVGSLARLINHTNEDTADTDYVIGQVVSACSTFSQQCTGALIVFERNVLLNHLVESGTVINADVSSMLIKNIFFKNASLHDGAMIIRENRILAAGCVLPNSSNVNLSRDLGTRHRAGVGASETSDAVVVIVSEETGTISVAVDGLLKRHLTTETLTTLLHKELVSTIDSEDETSFWGKMKSVTNGVTRYIRNSRKEDTDGKEEADDRTH